jgi:glycosyltransferase involved in cell wall biosynthesis
MSTRVCHLTSVHPMPIDFPDERIFIKESVGLYENGFEVTLIYCGEKELEYFSRGVRMIGLKIPAKNRILRMLKRPKIVYKNGLKINADIYHLHDPELLRIGVKLKKKGKKVIYDSHEDVPEQILTKDWIPFFLRRTISKLYSYVEKKYIKRIDAVVTVSEPIAERFKTFAKDVIVCHNYASLREFDNPLPLKKESTNICYLGTLSRIRGITELVEAAKLANVTLLLAGRFESDEYKNKILNEKGVKYFGYVNREQTRQIMSQCFVGMVTLLDVPNHKNSSPNKLFEYMAAGLPVVASDFSYWRVIVEGYSAGICVNPTDIYSISEAIQYLKVNKEISIKMGQNGRKAFLENYNWQVDEKKLVKLYHSLCAK